MNVIWVALFAALWLAVVLLGLVVLGLLRRILPLLERMEARTEPAFSTSLEGVPTGTTLAPFQVRAGDSTDVSSIELFARDALVLFLESGCGPCEALAPELEDVRELQGLPLIIFLDDTPGGWAFPITGVSTFYQSDRTASRAFGSIATPQAFIVRRGGVVGERSLVGSFDDLQHLAASQLEPAASSMTGRSGSTSLDESALERVGR